MTDYFFLIFWFYFFPFVWLIVFLKKTLFWIWLWQLKEYHLGRFLDHFRTEKGKKLFLNWLFFVKVFLFVTVLIFLIKIDDLIILYILKKYQTLIRLVILYLGYFPYFVLILFFLETLKILADIAIKRLKKPVLTEKTILLISLNFLLAIAFLVYNLRDLPFLTAFFGFPNMDLLFDFSFWLLLFDILAPFTISLTVLFSQPFFVFFRNQTLIGKARAKREKFKDLIVIGITGSYGKTSTKEFLATILSEKYKVLKTKEHQNSEVGISQCILNDLRSEHQIFVCEMGAYNKGGIKFLCEIAKPKIGILTGINEQHMATFGSQENIIKTKFELIESLPEQGIAILNWDNKFIKSKVKASASAKTSADREKSKFKVKSQKLCSTKEKVDFWAENIMAGEDWIAFDVLSKEGEKGSLKLGLFGVQNIENLLMAIACARELGMSFDEILRACEKIESWQGGMKLKRRVNGIDIIDATYSANPKGVLLHLDYLKLWRGKKIIVMPCLIELGRASREIHEKIGKKIGETCDLAIITTKDRFKEIKKGAISAGANRENILFLENPKDIFEKLKPYCLPAGVSTKAGGEGNVILLESRVPKQLIEHLTYLKRESPVRIGRDGA